jgi:uncharacterized protein (DUF934 family)
VLGSDRRHLSRSYMHLWMLSSVWQGEPRDAGYLCLHKMCFMSQMGFDDILITPSPSLCLAYSSVSAPPSSPI